MNLLLLAWEFFKTGLFAVGGGMATLPFLYAIADRRGWFGRTDVANMLAVSESTPGPVGVNMATYAGVTAAGILGGILTTFALVLPSVLVILLVASAMDRFRENRFVNAALCALRPVSVGLVAAAVLSIFGTVLLDPSALLDGRWGQVTRLQTVLTFGVLLAVNLKWRRLHPIVLIALGAAAGLLLQL